MSDEQDNRIGSLVEDRYRILSVMASGSMGSVYKAERVPVGKIVAIKFLHASYKNDSEFQARFERETRVMSKLAHPNCVSVLDFGVWNNAPYLVMEFVDGETLRTRLDKGPLPAQQALAFARQISSGLAHAHEQDIVHRDIKPANMMITEDIGAGERIRILDFGLARLRGNVGRDATQSNLVVGTPNYMAPEQTVPGAMIDGRTDIYAVGVVLFEMIVGERPFNAEDTLQLLGMHRAAPIPRLVDRAPVGTELPPGLQELIDKAMAKSPGDRYQNAMELAEAIDAVAGGRAKARPSQDITTVDPRRRDTGNASTIALDIDSSNVTIHEPRRYEETERRRAKPSLFGLVIVFGGAAAMAGYLIHRNAQQTSVVKPTGSGGSAVVMVPLPDAAVPQVVTPPPPATPDAPLEVNVFVPPDAAEAAAAPADAAEAAPAADAAVELGSAAGSNEGSGAGSANTEGVDPNTVEDPDPEKGSASKAEDEADDAPKTAEQIEARTPEAPHIATTIGEAVALIKDGKRELALSSLRALWKKNPRSSYIPFLLGNLYYDKLWWSVAMDHYALAIKQTPDYRGNATVNKNVIKMLSSPKTRQKATNFLRGTIGHPARAYLEWAAKHEDNPVVRKQAAGLVRFIR